MRWLGVSRLLGLGWLGLGRMWLGRQPLPWFRVRLWLRRQWLPRLWQRVSREWLSEWTGRRASPRGTAFQRIRRWEWRIRRQTSGWSTWRSRAAWRTRWEYGRSRTFGRINRHLGPSTWCAGTEIRRCGDNRRCRPYESGRNRFVSGTSNGRSSASKVHICVVGSRTFGRINRHFGASAWRAGAEIRRCGNRNGSKPSEPSRNNFVLGTPNGRSKAHIHVACSGGWPDGSPAGCKSVCQRVGC